MGCSRKSTDWIIRLLDLSGNEIAASGLAALVKESNVLFIALEELRLDGNRLGDKGARVLSSALSTFKSLKKIDLKQNMMSSDGAKYLSMAHFPIHLQLLDLRNNKFGYGCEGADKLVNVWRQSGKADS